jgi:hypothetical protein
MVRPNNKKHQDRGLDLMGARTVAKHQKRQDPWPRENILSQKGGADCMAEAPRWRPQVRNVLCVCKDPRESIATPCRK